MPGETPTAPEAREEAEPIRDLPYVPEDTVERFITEEIRFRGTDKERAEHRIQRVKRFADDNEHIFKFVTSMAKHSKDPTAVMEAVATAYEILRIRSREEREEGSIDISPG